MPPQAFETIKRVGPQRLHHAHGKRELLLAVALVGMEPTFHGHHADAAEPAADQLPGMADGGRARKVRDRFVGDRDLGLDLARQVAQARAENNAGAGRSVPPRADEEAASAMCAAR